MDRVKGKTAIMATDFPKKKLSLKDRVEILRSWKEPLFIGRDHFGTRRKLRIKSLEHPGIEAIVDFGDVLIQE